MDQTMNFCFNTMLNYQLFQKLKLLGNGEFNLLTIILTDIKNLRLHLNPKSMHN